MIIGLTGAAEAGKDTVGQIFAERYGFHVTSLAAPLKKAVQAKFGLNEWHTDTHEGKATFLPVWGMTVREILQIEGTEATRDVYGRDFWVKRWLRTVSVLEQTGVGNIVVTDVRFPEEAEAVLALGGYLLRVERPDHKPATLQKSEGQHSSEAGLPAKWIDWTITNSKDLHHLYDEAAKAMKYMLAEEAHYGV